MNFSYSVPFIGTNNSSFLRTALGGVIVAEPVAEIEWPAEVGGNVGFGFELGGHNSTNIEKYRRKNKRQ